MSQNLEPIQVFIDTQVFDSENYNFESRDLKRLRHLASEGLINIKLTSVTLKEIESHVDERATEAFAALAKFRKSVAILNPLPNEYQRVLKLGEDRVRALFRSKLSKLLRSLNVEVIPVTEVSPDLIMDAYFNKKPPFGDGKKKAEFPDAFAAQALEEWSRRAGQKVIVVSGDEDWKKRCAESENLEHVARLVEAFEKAPDLELAWKAKEQVSLVEDEIREEIWEKFTGMRFYLSENVIDGQVHNVEVQDVALGRVFPVEARERRAVVNVDCKVVFSADVIYNDPESWRPADDDSSIQYSDCVEKSIEAMTSITAEVRFKVQDGCMTKLVLDKVDLPLDISIGVKFDSVPPYYYDDENPWSYLAE
ncbi:MAG: hypothetical protein BGO49_24835 [Planctomycetales bacterium 71-10]|nr:MAG: hypothetical protein BGO49_24835 [Planctomycetales bacterium 71-10]